MWIPFDAKILVLGICPKEMTSYLHIPLFVYTCAHTHMRTMESYAAIRNMHR